MRVIIVVTIGRRLELVYDLTIERKMGVENVDANSFAHFMRACANEFAPTSAVLRRFLASEKIVNRFLAERVARILGDDLALPAFQLGGHVGDSQQFGQRAHGFGRVEKPESA